MAQHPPDMTHRAYECLRRARMQLSASPKDIRPFGSGSTLSWTITPPSDQDCLLSFRLNGNVVSGHGTLVVQPSETTEYRIEGIMGDTRMILAREIVTVVTDHCIRLSIPEPNVRRLVQETIDELCAAHPILSQRRQARVEVHSRGVMIEAAFKINIENAPDPALDVDCVVDVRAEGGTAEVSFRRFHLDLDWPRWVTIASAGVSKVAEQVIEDLIENTMKPALLSKSKDMLDSYIRMIPAGFRLYRIESRADEMTIIVCPSP